MTIQSSARWERAVGAMEVFCEFHCFKYVLGSQKNKNHFWASVDSSKPFFWLELTHTRLHPARASASECKMSCCPFAVHKAPSGKEDQGGKWLKSQYTHIENETRTSCQRFLRTRGCWDFGRVRASVCTSCAALPGCRFSHVMAMEGGRSRAGGFTTVTCHKRWLFTQLGVWGRAGSGGAEVQWCCLGFSFDGICCSSCKQPVFCLADYSLRLCRVSRPVENLVLTGDLCTQLLENAWALAGPFCAC